MSIGFCRASAGYGAVASTSSLTRLDDGELLLLATSHRPKTALADYRLRWGIETLFSALQTRGSTLNRPICAMPCSRGPGNTSSIQFGLSLMAVKPRVCAALVATSYGAPSAISPSELLNSIRHYAFGPVLRCLVWLQGYDRAIEALIRLRYVGFCHAVSFLQVRSGFGG